jgi:hypothetical protein
VFRGCYKDVTRVLPQVVCAPAHGRWERKRQRSKGRGWKRQRGGEKRRGMMTRDDGRRMGMKREH